MQNERELTNQIVLGFGIMNRNSKVIRATQRANLRRCTRCSWRQPTRTDV